MNDQNYFGGAISSAINWLVAQVKEGGSYGSTQATVLALKAITTYMKDSISINGIGNFTLRLNNTIVQKISFTNDTKEAIEFDFNQIVKNTTFAKLLKPGQNVNVSISLEDF